MSQSFACSQGHTQPAEKRSGPEADRSPQNWRRCQENVDLSICNLGVAHSNDLTENIIEQPDIRRLRRHLPNDLPTRFLA
jgi:hypothetical protein